MLHDHDRHSLSLVTKHCMTLNQIDDKISRFQKQEQNQKIQKSDYPINKLEGVRHVIIIGHYLPFIKTIFSPPFLHASSTLRNTLCTYSMYSFYGKMLSSQMRSYLYLLYGIIVKDMNHTFMFSQTHIFNL